jgi:hypothetical protein
VFLEGECSPDDVLVLNVTGSGFKDFDTLLAHVEVPSTMVESFEEMKRPKPDTLSMIHHGGRARTGA